MSDGNGHADGDKKYRRFSGGKRSLFALEKDDENDNDNEKAYAPSWPPKSSEFSSSPQDINFINNKPQQQLQPSPLYPALRPPPIVSIPEPPSPTIVINQQERREDRDRDKDPSPSLPPIHYSNPDEDPLLPDFAKRALEGVDEKYYEGVGGVDDGDGDSGDQYKSTWCQVLGRWHVLLTFSYLSFLQCLVWFTFSSVPDSVKAYYPSVTDSEIDLLLNWGPIIFIPALFVVAWMQNLANGLRIAFWIGTFLLKSTTRAKEKERMRGEIGEKRYTRTDHQVNPSMRNPIIGVGLTTSGAVIRTIPCWLGDDFRLHNDYALWFLHVGQILNAACGAVVLSLCR